MVLALKKQKRIRRHSKIKSRVFGTSRVPRLCVFKSAKHIYCQLIDDEKNKVILSANDLEIKKTKIKKTKEEKKEKEEKEEKKEMSPKLAVSYEVGKLIAKKAKENKIEKAIFDRGGFAYHGRIMALAEGAREGGLKI